MMILIDKALVFRKMKQSNKTTPLEWFIMTHFVNIRSYFVVIVLTLTSIHSTSLLSKPYKGPGRNSFTKAYKLEKTKPEESIFYYQRSLKLGLNKELKKAARWRLFYLFKDLKKYKKAIAYIKKLGGSKTIKKLKVSIENDISREFDIDAKATRIYIRSLELINRGTKKGNPYLHTQLQDLLFRYKTNSKFLTAIFKISKELDLEFDLSQSIKGCNTTECFISHIELLLLKKDYEDAIEEIYEIAKTQNLENQQKFKILYLLAKSYKHTQNLYLAIRYYRLAARYVSSEKENKILTLAAFSLYESGLKSQAKSLAKNLQYANGVNLRIFRLILMIEVDKNKDAILELQKYKSVLLQKKSEGKSKALVRAALNLIE